MPETAHIRLAGRALSYARTQLRSRSGGIRRRVIASASRRATCARSRSPFAASASALSWERVALGPGVVALPGDGERGSGVVERFGGALCAHRPAPRRTKSRPKQRDRSRTRSKKC